MKNPKQFKFDIIGLDCANCANKIERKINDTENMILLRIRSNCTKNYR